MSGDTRIYDFDVLYDRRGTNSDKWEGMSHYMSLAGPDTLPFWVADMDFRCPEPVLEALRCRVDHGIFGYASPDEGFYDAVQGWFSRHYAWDIPREDIFYTPGVVTAVRYLIQLLTQPGDGVVIQTPVYYPFAASIRSLGREVRTNPLVNRDGYYTMDLEDLEQKLAGAKLLIFCSPHNPVGRVWTKEELRAVADLCRKYQVPIVSDEIHCDLVRRGVSHHPLETAAPEYRNSIVTCTAPSKTFNLAGLQLSNIAIHDPTLQERWRHLAQTVCGISGPNVLSLWAARAAYADGENWLTQVCAYLDGNLEAMGEYLRRELPECVYRVPEGTYLAWLDLRALKPDEALTCAFVTEGGILVEEGSAFGEEGKGFYRVNTACPRPLLLEGMERMVKTIRRRG